MAGVRRKTLDRVLSQSGVGSRVEARRWIGEGRVQVNGKTVTSPDEWVDPVRDALTFDGKPLEKAESVYVLLYKPKGYVTTYKDPEGRPTVYDLTREVKAFLGTAGRLDMDSSGLLLLTNDHALADRLTSPARHIEKEYLVKAAGPLAEEQLDRLRGGVELDDGPTRPARVERVRDSGNHTFLSITLTEGRNRQVRRMLEAVGSRVRKLVRIRIGPLTLKGLEIGKWRFLTSGEVAELKRIAGLDADTESKRKLRIHPRDRPVLGRGGGRRRVRN